MAVEKIEILNQIRAPRFGAWEMTRRELAERVGVSRKAINAIEASKYTPSLEVAIRIARVFGRPMEEVLPCTVKGR